MGRQYHGLDKLHRGARRCVPPATTFTAGCRQRPAIALDATVSSFTPSAYTGISERTAALGYFL